MAMTPRPPDSVLLPCGRDPLDVIDAARAGSLDPHSRDCPYCTGVLDGDRDQRRIADELRTVETPAPETLLPAVMATVWAELRPGKQIPLPTDQPAFVTELAVGSLLQHVLDTLPGLEIQRCQVRLSERDPEAERSAMTDEESADQVGSPLLDVSVTAAVEYPADLPALADDIRRLTQDTLVAQLRLIARNVDVSFIDVYSPDEMPGGPMDVDPGHAGPGDSDTRNGTR